MLGPRTSRAGETAIAAEPAALSVAVRRAAMFDRRAVSWPAGLLAAVPVAALLGLGLAIGDKPAAVTMGAGAMLVGIAWRVTGGRPPLAVMATDAGVMAASTFVGCVTGSVLPVHMAVLCLWGLLGGLLVSLGPRGGAVGTQAIIAVVVFGRFSEPAPQALGLAGFVLVGGLAEVAFLTLVRWPRPLRAQRAATATAYRALADVAMSPSDASTLPAASALDEAQAALAGGALFGDPAMMTLRMLVSEGHRTRVQLAAIQGLLARAAEMDAPVHRAGGRVLVLTAEALRAASRAIEGDRNAVPALARTATSLSAEVDGLEPGGDGLDPGGDRHGRVPPGADHVSPARAGAGATQRQLRRRLAALAGQVRAISGLAPAAGSGSGLLSRRPQPRAARRLDAARAGWETVRANATLRSPAGRHALRLALVVPLAALLARELPLQRSYWMVVAAATIIRPEFGTTFTRGTERAAGTALGVALAGAIAVALHPVGAATVAIVGLLAFAGYATFPASFAVGFAFITALVVFLLNAINPDTLSTASARLVDTMAGGSLGLIVFALWPTWSEAPARQALGDMVAAQRDYLDTVMTALASGRPGDERENRPRSRRARVARTMAEATVASSLAEPARHRIDPERSQALLAAARRFVQSIHLLRLDAQEQGRRPPLPALGPLTDAVDGLLLLVEDTIRTDVPPTEPTPDLRSAFAAVQRAYGADPRTGPLVDEIDELVDAAGSLAAVLGLDPADPREG